MTGSAGRVLSKAEAEALALQLPQMPAELLKFMQARPVLGATFSVSGDRTKDGLDIEMRWMDTTETISEASEAYPGLVALSRGFVPVGICLLGSGDPYFYRSEDGALVRIPHDAASESSLNIELVEPVADSLESFLALAGFDDRPGSAPSSAER